MNGKPSTRRYDLFKLIITVILVMIIILLLLRIGKPTPSMNEVAQVPTISEAETTNEAPTIATEKVILPTVQVNRTETRVPEPIQIPATQTEPVPTASPTESPIPKPTAVAQIGDQVAAPLTQEPAHPTETASTPAPTTQVVAAPTAEATPALEAADCIQMAAPARLKVGGKGRVLEGLNMRAEASLTGKKITANPAKTVLEIIGGPVCQKTNNGAYIWWQVRKSNGQTGWSAEALPDRMTYLLEPNKP